MYLIDTNVISELRRPRPDPNVVRFMATHLAEEYFISEVTPAEIRLGIQRTENKQQRIDLEHWLDNNVRQGFAGRILPVNEDVLLRSFDLAFDGRKQGVQWSAADLILASTALVYDLEFVTRNVRHFAIPHLAVIDPWQPRS